jgi:acetyltransferase-like isoleucine patch superfamily enzyme
MSITLHKFTLDNSTQILGYVTLESPFRTYAWVRLNTCVGGAFSYISSGSSLTFSSIGRYCSIADKVEVLSKHPTNTLGSSAAFYQPVFDEPFVAKSPMDYNGSAKPTFIGNDVWIGSSVKIMPGVKIGDGAIVGAGSIVTKDVAPFSVVGGTPAKLIKMRFPPLTIARIQALAWWQYNVLEYDLPWHDLEQTLLQLEKLKSNGLLVPYAAPKFQIWHQNNIIVGRTI